jgi:hypothetical protein
MNRLFLHTARYSRCQLYVHGLCEYIPTDQKVRSSNLLGRTKENPVTDGVFLIAPLGHAGWAPPKTRIPQALRTRHRGPMGETRLRALGPVEHPKHLQGFAPSAEPRSRCAPAQATSAQQLSQRAAVITFVAEPTFLTVKQLCCPNWVRCIPDFLRPR